MLKLRLLFIYGLKDPSTYLLLLANLVIVYFTIAEGLSPFTVLWIYYIQSVIIGLFQFLKLSETRAQKSKTINAWVFASFYGIWHLVFLIFLLILPGGHESTIDWPYVKILGLAFLVNHIFSYYYNHWKHEKTETSQSITLAAIMRILPMHFAIIFGFFFINFTDKGFLYILITLKIGTDILSHLKEHYSVPKDLYPEISKIN